MTDFRMENRERMIMALMVLLGYSEEVSLNQKSDSAKDRRKKEIQQTAKWLY